MAYYLVKLLLMLLLVAGLAVGCLLAFKRYNDLQSPKGKRLLHIVETLPLSPSSKLAVVAFGDTQILLAITRNGIARLAQSTPIAGAPCQTDEQEIEADDDDT